MVVEEVKRGKVAATLVQTIGARFPATRRSALFGQVNPTFDALAERVELLPVVALADTAHHTQQFTQSTQITFL
jgi:hypothetical protein